MDKSTKMLLTIVGIGIGLVLILKKKQPVAAKLAIGCEGCSKQACEGCPKSPQAPQVGIEEKLIQLAQQQLGVSRDDLTIRSLIPSDFGATTWNFNLNQGNNTLISTSLADNRFIALTGISYPSVAAGNAATELTINAAARKAEIWPIQFIPDLENPVWEDSTPTIIQQNEPVSIIAYATKSAASEPIIFQGIVVERRGMTTA